MITPKSLVFQGQRYTREDLVPKIADEREHGMIYWDHFFETSMGHDFFAKALGYAVDRTTLDVPYNSPDYKPWQKMLKKLQGWLLPQLRQLKIEPYAEPEVIHSADLLELAKRVTAATAVFGKDVAKLAEGFTKWAKAWKAAGM
jgi:hypothetical protein